MKKIIFALVAFASFPLVMVSCTGPEPEFSPNGPTSDSTVMPWNRPTGPEGGGVLGGALQ